MGLFVTTERFSNHHFARYDERDDGLFYNFPRKVVHIDDRAIATLSALFAEILPPAGTYLDLMSSWRSHLPPSLQPVRMVGLGMNAEEMADNPQLDDYRVHDLNQNPNLPFPEAQFNAVLCTVSVQYMTQPLAIFNEVNRVLKPGGKFIVSFSNRCFQQKAVAIWLTTTDSDHISLVQQYFLDSGGWTGLESRLRPNTGGDPLYAIWAEKASPDQVG
jgi:SAM-dependent methyltransferase